MQNTLQKHAVRLDMSITRRQALAIQSDAGQRKRFDDDLIELARDAFRSSCGDADIVTEHSPELCFYHTDNGGMEVVENFRTAPDTFKFYAMIRFEYSPAVPNVEKATVVQEKKVQPRRRKAA